MQNCVCFINPWINLFVVTSVTGDYHPKVLERLHLLQCIFIHLQNTLPWASWAGHTMVWNGRKKSVWNMQWLKYEMEDLMYGMERIFHIPYLHILTWCCWSPAFLSVKHISKQSLSSTRTVILKLRVFFVISVTNSNADVKRRSLILILFSWGQGPLSPDICMFTSVLPACRCVRRDSYLASIASNVAL